MAKQTISTGAVANDGTGDTLRSAGQKINANFTEIYDALGDGLTFNQVSFDSISLVFEGNVPDAFETRVQATEPTADNIITLPDSSGVIELSASPTTLTNKTIIRPLIDSADFSRLSIRDLDSSHHYIVLPSDLAADRTVTLPLLTDDDTFAMTEHEQTLSNKTLYHPRIQQFIFDSVGQPLLELGRENTNSHIRISNADNPEIEVISDNANAYLFLDGKGEEGVIVNKLYIGTEVIDSDLAHTTAKGEKGFMNSGLIIANKPSALGPIIVRDGTAVGEMKTFINKNNGLATFRPTNFAQNTNFLLRLNCVAQLIWDGANWQLANGEDSANGTKPIAYTTA